MGPKLRGHLTITPIKIQSPNILERLSDAFCADSVTKVLVLLETDIE